jgi:hypothetical protein
MRQGQGYLTIACNTPAVDYLRHAYRLAESIKDTQQINSVSVIVNEMALKNIDSKISKMFDTIIPTHLNKFEPEAKLWHLSPYKQTIKIESDMLMSASIDHWWPILDEKDIAFTTDVYKPNGSIITSRSQRKIFDDNDLPNIYTGLFYFRFSKDSQKFFSIASAIFDNWKWFRDNFLKNCRYNEPVTDEVFAIAAKIYGIENCTLSGSVPSFVHMKNPLLDIPNDGPWWEYMNWEKSGTDIRIAHYQQHLPIHYCNKKFLESCYAD